MAERLRRCLGAVYAGLAGRTDRGRRQGLRAGRPGVRAERRTHPWPFDDRHGGGHQPLVPLRPDIQGDALARPVLWMPGSQGWRLGPLRRPGKGTADHRLADPGVRARLEPSAAPAGGDALLVSGIRAVAIRNPRGRGVHFPGRSEQAGQAPHGGLLRPGRAPGMDPGGPGLQPQPARPRRRSEGGRPRPGRIRGRRVEVR